MPYISHEIVVSSNLVTSSFSGSFGTPIKYCKTVIYFEILYISNRQWTVQCDDDVVFNVMRTLHWTHIIVMITLDVVFNLFKVNNDSAIVASLKVVLVSFLLALHKFSTIWYLYQMVLFIVLSSCLLSEWPDYSFQRILLRYSNSTIVAQILCWNFFWIFFHQRKLLECFSRTIFTC